MATNCEPILGNPELQLLCKLCGVKCTQSCGLCKKVNYCSKEHQKSDWKEHKVDCFPATIKSNEEFGRHLVASRDILQGELIFREKPLVSGPSGKDGLYPICLTCYRLVQSDYTCSKCKWPVCNILCENDSMHAGNECPIFAKNKINSFDPKEIYMYEKVSVLRGLLLKEKNEKAWQKVLNLQSHGETRCRSSKGCLLSNTAIQFVRDNCNLTQFNGNEIDHVVGAFGTNAFCSEDSPSCSQFFRSASYLFYLGSIPAHDCSPNSSWVIQRNSEYQLRACVNIPSGEAITQLYTQPFDGTLERRKHLKESKYFSCHCKRCSDPTELNTFFSALTCTVCKTGFLLPKDSTKEDSEWICNNSTQCTNSKSVQEIGKCTFGVSEEIESMPEENDLDSIKALEGLRTKYIFQVLHENHYFIYQLESDIMQRISYILTLNSTTHKLNKKQCQDLSERLVVLSKKNLILVDALCNGLNRYKGRLLYFLQQGLQTKILSTLNTKLKGHQKEKYHQTEVRSQIDELIEVRRQAGKIFENEPESREEYHLLKFLREYSKDMQIILKFYGTQSNKPL